MPTANNQDNLSTKTINDDQILDITSRFGALSTQQVSQVSTKLENFGDIVPVVLDILRKSTDSKTKGAFCIPAMLVAGVAGRKYTSADNQSVFVTRVLKEMGQEGQDWASLPKSEVFGGAFDEYRKMDTTVEVPKTGVDLENPLVFGYDCLKEGPVLFRPDCGHNSKFYFVTPLFALRLLMKMQSPRQGKYVDCFIAMGQAVQIIHDGGQVQIGEKVLGQVKDEDDDLRIVKKRRLNLELDRYEVETRLLLQERSAQTQLLLQERSAQTQLLLQEGQQKHVAFMMDMYSRASSAVDERDSIELRALVINQFNINTTNQQLAIQDTNDEIIDHISEVEKILGRKLKDGEKTSFGKALCKAYEEEYGEKPPTYSKRAGNGHPIHCRMYRIKHLPLITQVCGNHFDSAPENTMTNYFHSTLN